MNLIRVSRMYLAMVIALGGTLLASTGSYGAEPADQSVPSDQRQFDVSTLAGVYELALENDQVFAQSLAIYRAGWEERALGRSGILPQLTAGASYTEFDSEARGAFPAGTFIVPNNTDTDGDTLEWNAQLVQPLLDLPAWFRFKRGVSLSKEAEANFYVAQQDLLTRTIASYFEVLRAIENVNASKAQESALAGQLEQIEQRFEVGLVTKTDVFEAQAAFDLAVAQRISDEGQLGINQELLSVLTGVSYTDIRLLKEDFPVADPNPSDSNAWVTRATEENYEIKAAELSYAASRSDFKAARAEHLPKINLALGYSDSNSDIEQLDLIDDVTSQFPNDRRDLSAALRLTVPLYTGGRNSSLRRQAKAREEAEFAGHKGVVRRVTQETRAAYIGILSDVARFRARQQAVKSNKSALEATEVGYEFGTRNIVDVLSAQQSYFSAIRDFENSKIDYVVSLTNLKRLAGILTPADIYELNNWLQRR